MTFKVIRGQGQGHQMTLVPFRDYFSWVASAAGVCCVECPLYMVIGLTSRWMSTDDGWFYVTVSTPQPVCTWATLRSSPVVQWIKRCTNTVTLWWSYLKSTRAGKTESAKKQEVNLRTVRDFMKVRHSLRNVWVVRIPVRQYLEALY